jgi:hypothetical protein
MNNQRWTLNKATWMTNYLISWLTENPKAYVSNVVVNGVLNTNVQQLYHFT